MLSMWYRFQVFGSNSLGLEKVKHEFFGLVEIGYCRLRIFGFLRIVCSLLAVCFVMNDQMTSDVATSRDLINKCSMRVSLYITTDYAMVRV